MGSLFHFTIPEIGQGLVALAALAIVSGGLLSVAIMAMLAAQMLKKQLLRIGQPSVPIRRTLATVSSPASAR